MNVAKNLFDFSLLTYQPCLWLLEKYFALAGFMLQFVDILVLRLVAASLQFSENKGIRHANLTVVKENNT